jgi:hypothetical protein
MTQNSVQFRLDVEKTTTNKSVSTHLKNIFPDEELKNSVLQITQGKTLKKAEANKLLKSLMAVMVSEDLEEDEENGGTTNCVHVNRGILTVGLI